MNNTMNTIRPSAARHACRRADRAFGGWAGAYSLMELTVVLVIVALGAGIAVPRYAGSLSRYRVDMAGKRLAADLALAQSAARSTGTFQQVKFGIASDGYQLVEQGSLLNDGRKMTVLLNVDPYYTTIVTVKDGNGALVPTMKFDGFGQPDQSLTVKLRSGTHTRTVTVDKVSGAINVATP